MDNHKQNQEINYQDFQEVPPDQNYMVFSVGKKHKKLKNYDKAVDQFKSVIHEGMIYFNNTASNSEYFDKKQNGFIQNANFIVDSARNVIEVSQEPIIGSQLVILKKQKKNLAFIDKVRHHIDINPRYYAVESNIIAKEESEQQEQPFKQVYQMIEQQKQKNKKKKVKV